MIDLAGVQSVSSEALGKLLRLNHDVREAGGQLFLCNVRGLLEVFEVPQLDKLLAILPDDRLPEPWAAEPRCRLCPTRPQLDGAAVTELENRYEAWWYALPAKGVKPAGVNGS
jgi:hypothetical protein